MMDGHRLGNNVRYRHTLIQAGSGVLEDDLPGCFQHFMILAECFAVANINALIDDLACGGLVDIHNTPGNGGFTGAGLANQAENLTLLDLEGYIINSLDGGMLAQLEHMRKMLNIEKNFRHWLSLQSVLLPSALWDPAARWPHNGYR